MFMKEWDEKDTSDALGEGAVGRQKSGNRESYSIKF
jgi:hypothetical protein